MIQQNKPLLGSRIDPEHPLSKGLVLCLLFNEGSGNRIYDISGNGNDGALGGDPLWKPGQRGQAVGFDGLGGYVDCGNEPSLDIINAITLAAWVEVAALPVSPKVYIVVVGKIGAYYFGIRNPQGHMVARFWPIRETDQDNAAVVTELNTRVHLAVTYDQTNIKFYKNSILVKTKAQAGAIDTSVNNLYVGDLNGGALYNFNGLVSDARIWNRALSAQEVQDLYINPYGFIYQPNKYWFNPVGVTVPIRQLFGRAASGV